MMGALIISIGYCFLLGVRGLSIPSDWIPRVNSLNAFFGDNDEGPLKQDGYPSIYLVIFLPLNLILVVDLALFAFNDMATAVAWKRFY
jgi:hypothetical protein